MESNETNKLNIATRTNLGSTQLKSSVSIVSPDNIKITKVLTISAKPRIENINVNNMEVKFDGIIDYDVILVTENNDIVPTTQKLNFSQTFDNPAITPETIISIYPNVLELNNVSTSNNELVYSSTIEFDIYAVSRYTEIKCATASEDVYVKEGDFCFSKFDGEIVYDFRVDFEIEKNNKFNSVLYTTSSACLKSVIPSSDYFVASGVLYTTIIYRTEEGLIRSLTQESNFSEEIEAHGVTKESAVQVQIVVKETTIVENAEKNCFNFDVPLKINAQIYNNVTKKCIIDAYSVSNEVNLTTTSFNQDEFCNTSFMQDNIITSFTIDNNSQPIDRILSVVPQNISIVNSLVNDENYIIEGIFNLNVIYYSIDEENVDVLNSIDIDVPYSISFNVANLSQKDVVIPQVNLGDVSVKSKLGRELEILAEVGVNYSIVKDKVSAIISEISIGEEKEQKDYSLEIYLAKQNQELWDIAKELNISTEELINQNQNLSLPINAGDRIVVYRQRKINFE